MNLTFLLKMSSSFDAICQVALHPLNQMGILHGLRQPEFRSDIKQPQTKTQAAANSGFWTFIVDNIAYARAKSAALSRYQVDQLTNEQRNTVFYGFRQLNSEEMFTLSPTRPPQLPYLHKDPINASISIRAYFSSCVSVQNLTSRKWSSAQCQ
ncbi:unnamed protein product, partial [Protopolystoma xenopodis]